MRYLMPPVSAQTNERGELEFNIDPLFKALNGVEAARIRCCPICGFIFWASRKDKPCCTVHCAKIHRTRRWRSKYLDQYKLQRVNRQASSEPACKVQLAKEDRQREKVRSLPKRK
jgi:hypothetical protein